MERTSMQLLEVVQMINKKMESLWLWENQDGVFDTSVTSTTSETKSDDKKKGGKKKKRGKKKKKGGESKMMMSKEIKHYNSRQRILLVGEGDFSFAASLAHAFGDDASNMVATSLDSHHQLLNKYARAKANLLVLKHKGCRIVHGVDVHTMTLSMTTTLSQPHPFDRIVFNFPHSPIFLFREHHICQIMLHQDVVRGFFKSACKMVANDGEIHVTHKTAHPFDRWNIEDLAHEAGLCLLNKVWFSRYDYPGYINKKGEGHGSRCDASFPVGECYTFMFVKPSHPHFIIN